MMDLKQSINNHDEDKIMTDEFAGNHFENEEKINESIMQHDEEEKNSPEKYLLERGQRRSNFKDKISFFFFDFKDYLLTFLLLGSSLYDFSILNLPYTLAGILFLFLILKESKSAVRTKSAVVWTILFINVLNLLFKMFVITADNLNLFNFKEILENEKNLFLDLGIRYLEEKDIYMTIITFAGDIILLFGLIFSLVIRCIEKKKTSDPTQKKEKIRNENYSNIFMCLISLLTLGTTCINHSIISVVMSVLVHCGLLLWSLNKNTNYHKVIYYIICILLILTILLTHVFNIYNLRINFLYENSENKIMRWIGIKKMKRKIDYFFYIGLTVLAAIVCMVAIRLNRNVKENSIDDTKSDEEKTKVTSVWVKIKETVMDYLYSPYFSLHFCRLAIIYWVYSFNNYPTVGLLLWLIYSFLVLNAWKMRIVTFIIALPCLYYQYYVYMFSNMKGFLELFINITDDNAMYYSQFCIKIFDLPIFSFCCIQLTILLFAIFLKTNVPPAGKKKGKRNEISMQGVKDNLLCEDSYDAKDIRSNNDSMSVNSKSISLKVLIAKLLITNIDKITLIFMYIVAIQKVGVAHFILMIIFLIQLILPSMIKKICFFIILTILLIFSFEYIWDILKIHLILTEFLVNFINLFIEFDGSDLKIDCVEFVLPFIVYCFYFQYQNYHSTVYLKFQNKKINFANYLENILKNHKKFKNFILFSIRCIQELYVWIILILLFSCVCVFNYYVAFGGKLLLFFLVMYKFLTLSKNSQKAKKILKYIWIFIIYCGVNTMLIYFYQFTELKFIEPWYSQLESTYPEWLRENLSTFGFEKYSENLALKFLPHYGSNFLSVLLLWEISRIFKIKSEFQDNADIILEENKSSHEKIEINLSSRKISEDSSAVPKSLNLALTQDTSKIHEINYYKFYIFQFLIFFCKTYWLLIFLSISALIVNYEMSFGMILYIIIFSFSFNFMFKNIIKSMTTFMKKNNKFYLSRLIRFNMVESPKNIRVQKKNRKTTFKYLLVCGMMFIWLTYFYILFDIIQNGVEGKEHTYPIVSEDTEEYVKSIAYIFGVFYSNNSQRNFVGGIWGHILMICLISFDIYIQRAQNLMTTLVEDEKRKMKINAKIMNEIEESASGDDKMQNEVQDQIADNKLRFVDGSFRSARSNTDDSGKDKNSLTKKVIRISILDSESRHISILQDNIKEEPLVVKFLKVFEDYKNNIKFNKNKNIPIREKNISMTFIIATKKILEEFITFMILLSAILKLNVISFIYVIIVIIIQFKRRNVKTIYHITVFMCVSIITQTLIFLSNLNANTDPYPNLEILGIINKKLFIPWYPAVLNDSWAFYLNLGVNSYQINIVWIEFIIVITCFIYLDNFSYSIYDQESQIKKKINYDNLTKKNSMRKALTNMNEIEYEKLRTNLNYNFEIDLIPYAQIKSSLSEEEIIAKMDDKKNSVKHKKSRSHNFAKKLKKFTFLALHNIILLLTIILSMMNSGLISVLYIIFSLYYLLKSSHILSGKIYTFPHAIKKFLRIFFICDLVIQLMYQNPFNVYLADYDYILNSIGINKTVDYVNGPDQTLFNSKSAIMDCMKAVTYFLISLQIMIYSSSEFKEFYLNYIFKKKQIYFKNSLLNSFLFNNKKIKMMDRTAANRKQMDKVLNELESQLQMWDTKLSSERKLSQVEENKLKDNIFASYNSDEISDTKLKQESLNEVMKIKDHLKEKVLDSFMIKFALYIHRNTTSYSFIEKKYKKKLEVEIVKGETYIKSGLENRLEEFLDELVVEDILKDEYKEKIHIEDSSTENLIESYDNKEKYRINEEMLKSKNQPFDKIDEHKFNEQLKTVLYTKYITTANLVYFIFLSIVKFFLQNFQYVCFFAMIFNNIMYASLLSLFWPLAVFGYALIEYPRPKKGFWKISKQYASIVLILKFVIQFNLVKNFEMLINTIDTLNHYKIGLEVFESSYSKEFLVYIIFDVILILVMLLQEYFLIDRGIWEETEPEIERLEEAYDRVNKAQAFEKDEIYTQTEIMLSKNYSENKGHKFEENLDIKSSMTRFYSRVFPTIRNYKPGCDFYAFYTTAEMLLILYIVIFYTDMDQDNMFQTQGKAAVRQFSGAMVLIAFFHTIKTIIDRVIYLQNKNNMKFEYVFYEKKTGARLDQKSLEEMGINSAEDAVNNENISTKYYQLETTNYAAISKYVLQIVILVLSHGFIFFFLPFIGNINLQNSIYCENQDICNDFSSNYHIIIFYLIYCVYLFFSALQIQYGLLDMRKKSLFVRGDNIIYSSMFKAYKAIPFLYELKLTIDWTFTPTCLDLFKWLKFESVYDLLFVTHCTKKAEKLNPIGKNISVFQKIMMGGSSFVILLGIILGPLLLFSTLNPTNVENNVTGANIELSICFQHNENVFNNFTLFRNDYIESIIEMDKEDDIWKSYGYNNSSLTKNFPMAQVQILNMSDTSDTIWDIAGPHIDKIIDRLEHYTDNNFNITFGFKYNFQRPNPIEAKDSVKRFDYPLYISGKVDKMETIKSLLDNIKYCNKTEIILSEFYYPALRLSSSSHPKLIVDEKSKKIDVVMNLICSESTEGKIDYTKSYFTLRKSDSRDQYPGITFHTFSDKVSQTSARYDVFTFYLSSILVIGQLIRGAISGEAEKIILTEMPEPSNLINLCEGIKISRYRNELEREEHLYFLLIDFMRSPEILKILTKSSIKALQERKENNKNKY